MPLDVDKGIELPQLELISTKNDDCTTVYSTGNCNNGAIRQLLSLNLIFVNVNMAVNVVNFFF